MLNLREWFKKARVRWRMASYAKKMRTGKVSINEIRARGGLPPLADPKADMRFVAGKVTPDDVLAMGGFEKGANPEYGRGRVPETIKCSEPRLRVYPLEGATNDET